MGDPSVVAPTQKKFKTRLTDWSVQHADKTGPYADDLDVDAIIVGAGFSQYSGQTNHLPHVFKPPKKDLACR